MIGEILQAVINECKELLRDTGGTILFKTDFANSTEETFSMPLLLLDVDSAPDAGQQIGGLTRADWRFSFNSYNYSPNSQAAEDGGYAFSLLKIIDDIRIHFTNQSLGLSLDNTRTIVAGNTYLVTGANITYNLNVYHPGDMFVCVSGHLSFTGSGLLKSFQWLTQGMNDILNAYGFRFTLSGIVKADALDQDGLVLGYRIVFDSLAYDMVTFNAKPSDQVLLNVTGNVKADN